MDCEGEVVMINRAEIDTTAPFKSVKEAVALFGDTVLAGEIYAPKLKTHGEAIENGPLRLGAVTAELEETKYNLDKAREESRLMANCLCSLKEELARTKRELEQMKERGIEKLMMELEIEEVKIVPCSARYELNETKTFDQGTEFQNKRYVTFGNQPSFTQVNGPQGAEKLGTRPSLRNKKKKPLIPLIGALFFKKN